MAKIKKTNKAPKVAPVAVAPVAKPVEPMSALERYYLFGDRPNTCRHPGGFWCEKCS